MYSLYTPRLNVMSHSTGSSVIREDLGDLGSGWEIVRTRGSRHQPPNSICWNWQCRCTRELTIHGTRCSRPQEDQTRQHPSMDGRGARETPPCLRSYWQLLTVGDRESQFSLGLCPLRGAPGCGRWTKAHAHTASTKWSSELNNSIKKHVELGGESGGG